MLTKWLGRSLAFSLAVLVAATLIGRAAQHEARTQERVIATQHGRTVDCRVDRFEDGSIALNDCNYVQFP